MSVDDGVTLALPPDAVDQHVQPIDSIFRLFRGDGYQLIVDYGRFAETVESVPGATRRDSTIDGRRATETRYSIADPGQPLRAVRVLQVKDGARVLTIRMSCVDEAVCAQADDVFGSLEFSAP